jgi:orotidine-5'-phosphate decarboxylase
MTASELYKQILSKRSFLCVGLDTDLRKIPGHLRGLEAPLFEFNRAIVDATAPYAVAFKPNLAFYEAHGADGVAQFEATCRYIRERHPETLIIADAKRGDIGNTSEMYARAFYDTDLADAVTLAPYMGRDTIEPFLRHQGRWAVILALTSNPSADDFETLTMADGRPLWKHVLGGAAAWGSSDNTMFVVGATRAETLREVREIVPDHFLLVPGVGAQGGSLAEVARWGMNPRCGLLVNSSRGIIYASDGVDFATAAAAEAKKMADEMSTML